MCLNLMHTVTLTVCDFNSNGEGDKLNAYTHILNTLMFSWEKPGVLFSQRDSVCGLLRKRQSAFCEVYVMVKSHAPGSRHMHEGCSSTGIHSFTMHSIRNRKMWRLHPLSLTETSKPHI